MLVLRRASKSENSFLCWIWKSRKQRSRSEDTKPNYYMLREARPCPANSIY